MNTIALLDNLDKQLGFTRPSIGNAAFNFCTFLALEHFRLEPA